MQSFFIIFLHPAEGYIFIKENLATIRLARSKPLAADLIKLGGVLRGPFII